MKFKNLHILSINKKKSDFFKCNNYLKKLLIFSNQIYV